MCFVLLNVIKEQVGLGAGGGVGLGILLKDAFLSRMPTYLSKIWIISYLRNRQQFVKLGDVCSACLDIVCGVPQGSVLGPKLVILYINDICGVSQKLKMVLFADGTNIFCSGDNLKELLKEVTNEMSKMKLWFNQNENNVIWE